MKYINYVQFWCSRLVFIVFFNRYHKRTLPSVRWSAEHEWKDFTKLTN